MHDATDVYAREAADGDSTFDYETARDATLDAHKSVFPFSFCDRDCMEEQLDSYYDCACGTWFNDDLNANTSVGMGEKDWRSKPLNGKTKTGVEF